MCFCAPLCVESTWKFYNNGAYQIGKLLSFIIFEKSLFVFHASLWNFPCFVFVSFNSCHHECDHHYYVENVIKYKSLISLILFIQVWKAWTKRKLPFNELQIIYKETKDRDREWEPLVITAFNEFMAFPWNVFVHKMRDSLKMI